jgi:hypothetical protein
MPKGQQAKEKKEKVKSDPNAILPGMIRVQSIPAGKRKDPALIAKIEEDKKKRLETETRKEAEKAQMDALLAKKEQAEKFRILMATYQNSKSTGVPYSDKIRAKLITAGIIDEKDNFLGTGVLARIA